MNSIFRRVGYYEVQEYYYKNSCLDEIEICKFLSHGILASFMEVDVSLASFLQVDVSLASILQDHANLAR